MSATMNKVREIIAEALYLDLAEVTPDASLMKDLGAESIDFLDIIFRLEKQFGIKIPKGEIERKARGGLSDEEFAQGGVIQAKGLAALRHAMPEIDAGEIVDGLTLRDLPGLFNVATFARMVAEAQGEAPAVAVPAEAVAVPVAAARPVAVSQPAARL